MCKSKSKILAVLVSTQVLFSNLTTAFASGGAVGDSKLATGTEALIKDVTTWLMIIAPIVGGLLIIYFFIRRSGADEQDQKRWNNRITTAIVSVIGTVLGSAIINLISHSVVDFLAPEIKMYGQALLDIPCFKVLMGSDGRNLTELKELYNLTDAEESLLEQKKRGSALLMVGSKRLKEDFEIPQYKFEYMGKAGGR